MTDPRAEGGTVLPIVQVGDPVLANPCTPITEFDDDLARLVSDMFASMYAAEGVGLAANQIGVNAAVFVYDCPDESGQHQTGVVCNPVLRELPPQDRSLFEEPEGCLSVKGQFSPLARPDLAIVAGQDEHGQPIEVSGTGLLARCLQHETDHLNGMLYIDRLTAKARKQVLKAWRESQDEGSDGR